ncbi:MAG: winged helix-turn-helix domain-containing protein [Patescibacteria group bacterium]
MKEPQHLFLFERTRLLILRALFRCSEDVCGCDLVDNLGVSKYLVSYHIKKLREKGFVDEVKCGNRKEYIVAEGKRKLVKNVLRITGLLDDE